MSRARVRQRVRVGEWWGDGKEGVGRWGGSKGSGGGWARSSARACLCMCMRVRVRAFVCVSARVCALCVFACGACARACVLLGCKRPSSHAGSGRHSTAPAASEEDHHTCVCVCVCVCVGVCV